MALTSSRLTSAPVLAGALIVVTVLAAGPLQSIDAALQGYWAKKYTPNWADFLDSVPNAVAGQAVCLPVLLGVAIVLAHRHRTWHPLAIVVAAEAAFYVGVGGMKVLLGRTAPAAGEGFFWEGGALQHGWYGIAYPSGHAAEAILIYGAAAYLLRTYAGPDTRVRRRLTWLVGLVTVNAVVVAFYLGYHWPTDLLGGLLAGGLLLRVIIDVDRRVAAGRPVLGLAPRTPAAAPAATLEPVPVGPRPPVPALGRSAGPTPAGHRQTLPQPRPTVRHPITLPAAWDRPTTAPVLRGEHASTGHRTRQRELQTSARG